MNIPTISASYRKARQLLSDLNLLETENTSREFNLNFNKFSSDFFQNFQDDDYDKIYKICIQNSDYDLLLKDGSFFQFSVLPNNTGSSSINKGNARFAYYQNPREHYNYEDFLKRIILSEMKDVTSDEVGDMFYSDYEQYISESKLKNSVTPIRYDYDVETYSKDKHPCSHFHIGLNNNIRLGTDKFILPYTFICFIIQHIYYDTWKSIIDISPFFKTNEPSIFIENDFFSDSEKKLIYIT